MIRRATIQDYEQIRDIKQKLGLKRESLSENSYKEKVEKEGFLLYSDLPLDKYTSYLSDIFLVDEEDGKILGFIQISSEHEMKTTTPVEWYEDMQQVYFSEPHAGLHRIAVDPAATGKGVAGRLLEEAIRQIAPEIQYLFSIVVISPVKNNASIHWHEKNGFEKVALISRERNAELDNYKSILYAKKLH